MWNVLRRRDFRLLWLGESISLLGDQFHMIALPWLVLQLTGNGLAVGGVLAVAGLPRAVFILVGGVITDRFSARSIMLLSNLGRMLLVGLLTVLVLTNQITLWMLYVLALAFGLIDAFFFPASASIVPHLVDHEDLQAANALVSGVAQFSLVLGPILAGALIAVFGSNSLTIDGETVPDLQGIGLAFAFDALTFLASLITLWFIRPRPHAMPEAGEDMLQSIRSGLAFVWQDRTLRGLFLVIAGINLLFTGPLVVGVPYLADTRFPEGAAAFGLIMSAWGGGLLLGTILAGVAPRPPQTIMGTVLLVIITALGIGLISLAFMTSTAAAGAVALLMGIANGYAGIIYITWLQMRTPEALLGRMMSLAMLASVGLQPISLALAGALVELNPTALFIGAGGLLSLFTLRAVFDPALRSMAVETT